jgi:hypothetical protein
MPSSSKSQQKAAGMALAAKEGKMKVSELKGAAKKMYDSMSKKQLKDFAETKHKGLPEKVKENKINRFKDFIVEDFEDFEYNEPNKIDDEKNNLLLHAVINQLEYDFNNNEYDSLNELLKELIKNKDSKELLKEYLSEEIKKEFYI